MTTPSDPPVRGSAAVRESGKPEFFRMRVLDVETEVPTEDKELQIVVKSGEEVFTLPLDKRSWSLEIKRIAKTNV